MLQYLIYLLSAFVGIVIIYVFVLKDDSPAPKPAQQKQDDDDVDDPTKPRMLILYGSQTGTAEEFSQTFAGEAKRFGFKPKVMDLVDFDNPEDRFQKEKLVIFIVATYGEGEPTDNARDFFEWIRNDSLPKDLLNGVQYSVFGLGNKQYKIFNAVARIFDKRLEQIGAKRIFEKGEGDADDNIEEHFEDWKGRLLPELSQAFETNAEAGEETIEQKYEIRYHPDAKLEVARIPFDAPRGGPPDAKNPFTATVIANRQLLTVQGDRSTVHVEFNIKGSRMTYEAGDHLAVLPENEDSLVAEYARRLGVADKLDQVITLVPRKHKEKPPYFPKKCTLGSALKYYLDLTSVPRKKIIRGLYMFAKDEKEKQELHVLASNTDEGKSKFKHFVKDTSRNVLDILNHYKSVSVPIDFFLELVPRLQPRYYSIASSSKMHPEAIHVMVSVVRYKSTLGVNKQGVCSSYLERLSVGSKAFVFVRQSSFKLPSDHSKPVIMVGPGTGLAPFVGFLQQRRVAKQRNLKLGDAYLFFGCRKQSEDFVYEKDMNEALSEGAISKLLIAFSRDQSQKVYVQNKLWDEREKVFEMLEKGGNFYVCGDAKHMAKDVDDTLAKIISTCGNKSADEAKAYIDKLASTSRYLRDVWAPS